MHALPVRCIFGVVKMKIPPLCLHHNPIYSRPIKCCFLFLVGLGCRQVSPHWAETYIRSDHEKIPNPYGWCITYRSSKC